MGEIGRSASLNRYAYVEGDPVTMTDPFGLCGERVEKTVSGALETVTGVVNAASGYAFASAGIGYLALFGCTGPVGWTVGAAVLVAVGAYDIICGSSDIIEGITNFVSGIFGTNTVAVNPVRDYVFKGNQDLYTLSEMCSFNAGGELYNSYAPLATAAYSSEESIVEKASYNNPESNSSTTKVKGTYGELVKDGQKDAHHIIQDAAMRDIPGYNRFDAPAIQLDGPANSVGTEHYYATCTQRELGGGTYGAEREIAYNALLNAGLSSSEAGGAVAYADEYFCNTLGLTNDTVTRIPGNRR